jgi:glucose-6-phosphate dehydrogenase assembly protein OpcA
MGRQLVYDSRRWQDIARGVQALAPILTRPNAPDLADLNWRRLLPMRQALMQAVSPTNLAPAVTIAQARIQHRPGDAVLAWLLAGWFCSRLGWSFDRGCPITLEEAASDETLSVAVGAGDSHDIVAAMDEHRVVVTYRENAKPFTVAVPQESDAEAVAAELRTLAVDRCLREALVALTHRFGAS